jgi:hypothetical protein
MGVRWTSKGVDLAAVAALSVVEGDHLREVAAMNWSIRQYEQCWFIANSRV